MEFFIGDIFYTIRNGEKVGAYYLGEICKKMENGKITTTYELSNMREVTPYPITLLLSYEEILKGFQDMARYSACTLRGKSFIAGDNQERVKVERQFLIERELTLYNSL